MPTTQPTWTISEVAAEFNLSIPTLRYYDQQGLIPGLQKNAAGAREFTSENRAALHVVECLKRANMSLKDIRQFMDWTTIGDATLPQRLAMFQNLRQTMQHQLAEMQATLAFLDYKCDYYQQATADGTERYVKERHATLPES